MGWGEHIGLVRLGAGIGHAVSLPALAAVGLLVGYFAGMFGVGGGFLLTPVLIYVFGVPRPSPSARLSARSAAPQSVRSLNTAASGAESRVLILLCSEAVLLGWTRGRACSPT